jgi:PTS system fructose-specific IIC component
MPTNDIIFQTETVVLHLQAKTKEEAIEELVGCISVAHPQIDPQMLYDSVLKRESQMSTALPFGVAIPHGTYPGIDILAGAYGYSKEGIAFGGPEVKPVHSIFLLALGESCREKHLHVLSRIMKMIKAGSLPSIEQAASESDACDLLCHALQ